MKWPVKQLQFSFLVILYLRVLEECDIDVSSLLKIKPDRKTQH